MKLPDSNQSGIYCILNIVNGKSYIGSSQDMRKRWKDHRYLLDLGEHHSLHLQRSWEKHGMDAFVFHVVEVCDIDSLLAKEQLWIDSVHPEYNILLVAGTVRGYKHTDECKDRMRQIKLDNPPHSMLGFKHSDETKEVMRNAKLGNKLDSEHKRKISEAMKGRVLSNEHCQNLRKKKNMTPEGRQRLSELMKARRAAAVK